jgi:hypothetical protein
MARRAPRSLSPGSSNDPGCRTTISAFGWEGCAGAPADLLASLGRLKVRAKGQPPLGSGRDHASS